MHKDISPAILYFEIKGVRVIDSRPMDPTN